MRYHICHEHDLPCGEKRAITVKNIPIVLIHGRDGAFHAVYGLCSHQKGPLSEGHVTGMTTGTQNGEYLYTREGEILRCPWHGFEFDVKTGRCLADPLRQRIRVYPVIVDNHEIFLDI
ncbi:Rieske (2Fe-2S) protein [Ktedonosporobacter rubrisoli]|uniref:Rieske (2Fe-2S) protein n=1 Tax=Ktedonosporobacter rubrisoli TaxID=2509675 RepID=A0A4P6K362_KTERU|nr:Rieske (2Fe-2S) protein [Ktedonosporobacter rubrisoli]QBD82609.1 Rieske (2Fe-2S) protein [Ktedonosporobacter rubrisoli]